MIRLLFVLCHLYMYYEENILEAHPPLENANDII